MGSWLMKTNTIFLTMKDKNIVLVFISQLPVQ